MCLLEALQLTYNNKNQISHYIPNQYENLKISKLEQTIRNYERFLHQFIACNIHKLL